MIDWATRLSSALALTRPEVNQLGMRTIGCVPRLPGILPVALLAAVLLAAVLLLPERVSAQTVVRGTLLDERTDQPVPQGLVSLLNETLRIVHSAQTDENGQFELRTSRDGWYTMRSQRQGYLNAATPRLELAAGDTIDLEFRISPDAVFLAPITVIASSRRWWEDEVPVALWSFYERMDHYQRLGQGRFLQREDLEPFDGMTVAQMLTTVPGVRLIHTEEGIPYPSLRAGTGILRPCQPEFFVDGVRVPFKTPFDETFDHGDTIDSIVSVSQLVGVEVYAGVAQVPGEFGGLNSNCGVVAVWTSRQG